MGELSNLLKEKKTSKKQTCKSLLFKVEQNNIQYQIRFSSLSLESTM